LNKRNVWAKLGEKMDDLRSSITHALPHEINTPLNHIMGMSKLLIEEYGEPDQVEILEMLEFINKAGQRLHRPNC
jgi:K+-sensing histidine kinase KdpD